MKYAPNKLLFEIGKSATVTTDGVSWPGSTIYTYETAVTSSVVILDHQGDEIWEIVATSIVWKSVIDLVKRQGSGIPIKPHDLLQLIDDRTAEYLRQPLNDYVYVTSLSLASFPGKRITALGCRIQPLTDRSIFAIPECLRWIDQNEPLGRSHYSSSYQLLRVDVRDRSMGGAVAQAGYAVDFIRGLWTLFATRGSQSIKLCGVRYDGIGVIYTGAVQTLHHLDGNNVDDTFWYDPDIPSIHNLFPKASENERWLQVERSRCWAQRQLRTLPYAKEYRSLIARYARALDHTNLDLACLQLWAMLETITGTVGKSYDQTISRTLWDYSDRDTSRHLLDFLRLRRNQYVHASISLGDRQYAAYLLKGFVDHHLIRLLRNDFKVQSFLEYGEFLDLPSNLNHLKSRRDRLQLAVDLKTLVEEARAAKQQSACDNASIDTTPKETP